MFCSPEVIYINVLTIFLALENENCKIVDKILEVQVNNKRKIMNFFAKSVCGNLKMHYMQKIYTTV